LISSGERRVQIETGSGIQSILPDAKAVGIIETEITPRFKQQDFDGGTVAGTKALVNVLQTPMVNAQSQTTLPLAPIVPSQGVKPSPIPSQSPVISNSKSTGEDLSNSIILGLFILVPGFLIFNTFRSLFSRKSASPSHHRYSPNNSSSSDYSSSSSDYSSSSSSDYSSSSSSSDSGGSFGGGDSSGGGGGGGY